MQDLDMLSVGSWSIFDHLFLVERLPEPGDTVQICSPVELVEKTYRGGCSANAAVVGARLGLRTGLGMVCGEDFEHGGYARYLEAEGVNLDGVTVLPGERSGHSFIYTDPDGNSVCISHIGVSSKQEMQEVDDDLLARTRAVLLNYRFDDFSLRLSERARALGKMVALSGSVMSSPDIAGELIQNVDYLFCNRHELDLLLRHLGLRKADELLHYGPSMLFTTDGQRGSTVLTREYVERIPIAPASAIIDTTGAGDAFAGAALSSLIKGFDALRSARIGAVVASFVIEQWGAQTNIPDWDATVRRYAEVFGGRP